MRAYLPQWEETLIGSVLTTIVAAVLYPVLRSTLALVVCGALFFLSLLPLIFIDAKRRPATGFLIALFHLPWLWAAFAR